MRKSLLTALICSVILILAVPIHALLVDYTFNQTTGTYTEITGGMSLGTETTDDQRFVDPAIPAGGTTTTGPGFPIGFNFPFNDDTFDVIAVNANGWISLGQSALGATAVNTSSTSAYSPLSSVIVITPTQLYNRVAGFGRDIQAQAGASLRIETIGTAPNRICVIQWKNYKRYGTTGTGDIINFQIKLYETSYKVTLSYGAFTHGTTTNTTYPQIGMRGPDATDFVNRTTTDDWSATTPGTANNATCAFNPTCIPTDGLIFEFIAPVSATNDLQCLSVTGSTTPSVGAVSDYTIRIRNRGTAAQSTYTVKLMLGTTEIGSVPGTTITPLQVLDFTIPWTPAAEGPAALTGKVVLVGDEVTINDESSPLAVNVYPAGTHILILGTGTSAQSYPFYSNYGYVRDAAIYTAAELENPGLITGIMWDMAVQYGNVVPYRILLKTTTATALVAEPWATTIADAQLCVEGTVTFDELGWVYFPFTTPFFYSGDNLVVMVETNFGGTGTTSSQTFRYTTSTTASHHYMYQENTPPTTNGYVNASRPNVGIFFNTTNMGSLGGLVTTGGNPLEGAAIEIQTTGLTQITNTAGTYNFPYVIPGTYQVSCTKLGFLTQTQPAVITEGQATTLNFVMLPAPNVDVTGLVVGSDAPTVGLADATVNLTGIIDYTGTTNASGQFTITGVLAGNTYNYSISKPGYQSATGSITLGTANYNMGTITLNEITSPPIAVHAEPNPNHTEVLVNWRAPGAAGPGYSFDFEIDDGGWVPSSDWTNPLGDWQWTNTYDVTLYDPSGSTYTQVPPQTAHSGTGMWGTVIYGPYSNLPVSGQRSFLKKTFDLTGMIDPILNLWHYMDGYNTWDYGQILVNGTVVWGDAALAVFMPWQVLNVDLSAYENQANVEVSFEWSATTVVNYAGWYIDDIYIGPETGLPPRIARNTYPEITPYNNSIDRSLLGYKVWRLLQGQETNEASWTLLTATTITDTFYVNTNWQAVPDGEYKWAVKSVYTGNILSVPAISNMVLKHAVVNVTGLVVGSDAPTAGLAGAEVTLSGMADYSATTNAQGQFTIPGVYNLETYGYTITKPGYTTATGSINVGAGNFDMGTVTLNEITIPAGAVQAVLADPNVNVTWMAPGTGGGEWIQWDDGTNFNSIGLTSGGTFDVASRWPAADLTDYVGQSLFAIKLWPGDAGTYRIRVWTGGSASGPAQMVYDEEWTGYTIDAINTVNLTTPVAIQAGQELWFGYNVTHATGAYPAGTDDGPAHDGLGNMIYNSGAWTTLYTLSTSLNYDWNLSGYVGYSAPTAVPIRMAPLKPIPFDYVSLNTGGFAAKGPRVRIQNNTPEITHSDTRSLEGYKVWRLLEGQESNEAAWTLLTPNTITATAYQDMGWSALPDGFYKWAVKAVYSNDVLAVPAFSNALQKLTQIGTIAGIVRQTNNTPIVGATITVGTTTATSNATGAYSLQVPAGTHTVTCSAPGFATGTQTGIVVVTGQTTTVNFILAVANLVTDGYETYTNFAIDFAPWVNVDVDLSTTYTITGVTFLHGGEAMAYIVFNPSATTPPLTTAGYTPHGGNKYAACFAGTTPPNNDWLISQQFNNIGQDASVGFWAKSVTADYGLERFKVGISSGGTAPANFTTFLSGATYIQAPITWTWYEYDIPASYVGQSCRIGIQCVSNDAFIFMVDDFVMDLGQTSNDDPVTPVVATALNGNFPNPFNPETTISYAVKGTSPVTIEIYNTKGQRVKTLVNETKAEGHYDVKWDGTDFNNTKVTSGVYFYKMNAGKYTSTRKMILMK